MTWLLITLGVSLWVLLVAIANLQAMPSKAQEKNDYGEKWRTS